MYIENLHNYNLYINEAIHRFTHVIFIYVDSEGPKLIGNRVNKLLCVYTVDHVIIYK